MSTEKINELKVKLSGTVNIPTELITNTTIDLKITNADCEDYRLKNNQNGEFDKIFSVKVSELSQAEFIQGNEKVVGEKKKSASQKLRGRAYIWSQENDITEPEMFYETIVNKIINNFDFIVEALRDK